MPLDPRDAKIKKYIDIAWEELAMYDYNTGTLDKEETRKFV